MIDVKQAVARASEYFFYLLGLDKAAANVQLEEVELSDDDMFWHVTLSYHPRSDNPFLDIPRKYKIFKVNATTGNVVSMRIRDMNERPE